MKIYTTTTSERGKPAEKGGNSYTNTIVQIGNKERKQVLRLDVRPSGQLERAFTVRLWSLDRDGKETGTVLWGHTFENIG